MTFEEFQQNVIGWATERGIYEHSTPLAQALKACSEAGELCDAVIKGDRDAMADAVGDVAVCLVNVAYMCDVDSPCEPFAEGSAWASGAAWVATYCGELAKRASLNYYLEDCLLDAFFGLQDFCEDNDLKFLACCEKAWNEIKDRKGRMVAGGAFVKD